MNDKTRNKLNHILESVPISREHKSMLVEVFDEVSAGGGNGGNNKENYEIILNTKTNKVYFQNIEYNCNIESSTESGFAFIDVTNNKLHKVLVDYFKNNNVLDMFIFEDNVTIKSRVVMQFLDPTNDMIFIGAYTEVMTSITFHS